MDALPQLQIIAAGVPFGTPAASTSVPCETVGAKPRKIIGRDGKVQNDKASKEVIIQAWAMKDSGMSTSSIAKDIYRGKSTVRSWFAKERPEAVT